MCYCNALDNRCNRLEIWAQKLRGLAERFRGLAQKLFRGYEMKNKENSK